MLQKIKEVSRRRVVVLGVISFDDFIIFLISFLINSSFFFYFVSFLIVNVNFNLYKKINENIKKLSIKFKTFI